MKGVCAKYQIVGSLYTYLKQSLRFSETQQSYL